MKFRVQKEIEKSRLKDLVPTAYKGLASALEATLEGPVTLITFPHDRKDVVKSSMTLKALSKIDLNNVNNLVVVGGCFSAESVEILQKHSAYFLSLSEFHWTDKRHTQIKAGAPKSNDKP